ncbi:retrovirus-related pol polyprotein from transposon TNT 1-94 [Tanacetum coccineum]
MDENGIVIKNKAMLVAQGYNQQEGIDYEETFALIARLEATRIFLAYAAYMGFMVYQMHVKSAFLNGKISEEVYVQQPHGFESSEYPNHICKLDKALYGLKQAPKAWYETLSKFLIQHKFVREKIVKDLLKKYDLADCALVKCPMLPSNNLGPDESGVSVNETLFRGMIGSLMYLIASRLDIQFSICLCARYLKGTPNLGLLYPKGSGFDLKAYSDSDYDGCNLDRKSTSGAEAEYVAAAGCCAQVLWIKSQLADYDVLDDKVPIFYDNTSVIAISNNPVLHSRTKHIDIRTLTLQPIAMYVEYLKEFWYTSEVEEETKTITFLLSWWDKPLSFTQDEFISAIGLPICRDDVPLPPKETVFIHIFENFIGKDYVSNDLTLVKPHPITAASFQKSLASEVTLTSHMLKVAKLSEEPEQSLLPPSGEVNADDTADKSLSKAFVQPVTQSKATTDLKTKKKKIPPSSKPKSPYKVRVILPKKQVAETQQVEVTVATTDATKSLEAFELAEEQGNQPSAVEVEKVLDQNVEQEKDAEFVAIEEVDEEQSLEIPTVEQLLDEADKLNKAFQETPESPYDTGSEIKVVKSFLTSHISELQDQTMHDYEETADIHEDSDSDLQSMPDDDLRSISGFDIVDYDDTHKNKVSKSDHIFQDDNAFAERLSLLDHMDHICDEVSSPHLKLGDMESSIVQQVSAKIKSSLPALVTNTLKDQLPSFLSDALKDTLPQLLKDSIKSSVFESIAKELPHVEAQKELSKSLYKNMRKSIRLKVRKEMKEVRNKLSFCTSTVATNSQHVQDLRVMFKDMVSLLEAAEVFKKANAEGERWEKNKPSEEKDAQHPDQTKGSKSQGSTLLILFRGINHQLKL